jgi:hypothetical protein
MTIDLRIAIKLIDNKLHINPLQPSCYYFVPPRLMFNKFCVLRTECIHVFRMDPTEYGGYYPIQHELVSFHN